MFGLFRSNPVKKLEKLYSQKMEEARDAQRTGKIPVYATLVAEAEDIGRRIDHLKNDRG